jgi:thiol-disulfide isomerase/thioredoxin
MLNKSTYGYRGVRINSGVTFALGFLVTIIMVLTYNPETMKPITQTTIKLPVEGNFPSLDGATGWINSQPLTPASLKGKVVLVEFWTYTCINWMRVSPYVRAWAKKYKDKGLVVIGVHAPEFSFEKNIDNVRSAVKERNIDYPVAIDNDQGIWNAFNNRYWPALYFIDAKGNIRHRQFGEGEYEQSEKVIQQLLLEKGEAGVSRELVSVNAVGDEAAADWNNLQSGENYLGYLRTENFTSSGGVVKDKQNSYTPSARLRLNDWTLGGEWTMKREAIVSNKENGRLVYRFHARDVNLVMGPSMKGTTLRFRVLIDGKTPGDAHGTDIDSNGNGTVTEQRMYQLIRQNGMIGDHQFEIEFLDAGVEVYAFTFG